MEIMWPVVIYIVAISLQLAGAELLIMNYWSKPFQKLKKEELDKQPHVDIDAMCFNGESETEISRNILCNRFAFVLIAFGYLFGIFGDMQDYCKWFVAFWVLVISVVIALGTNFVVGKMIKPALDKEKIRENEKLI